ncbi:MAG: monovalent cation/H+ antiporter complex subunit F [Planctomycetota bacterium]
MIPTIDDNVPIALLISAALLGFGIFVSLWRLLAGPSLPDRVIALDLIGFMLVGLMCLAAIVTDQQPLLSVALMAGLILFLGTTAFAIYLQRRGAP